MKKVYVAATQQHDGKTTVSVGLYKAAQERGYNACFIKPVGQRYQVEGGVRADEDAVLFKHALLASGELQDLSPITIPRGYTQQYVFNPEPERIHGEIHAAFDHVSAGKDLAIIEGTGHAGVGSVIDASNGTVASMLGADCVLVTQGGIGRCIDEVCLNQALFEKNGVRVIGAVVNKVFEEKYDKIAKAVRQGLKNAGVECLGVIPYRAELTYPTITQLRDELTLEVLCGEQGLGIKVRSIIIGAMEPQNMIQYLEDGCLVVVPGDRVDNIIISINAHLMSRYASGPRIAGLLLTGGMRPHASIMDVLLKVGVPVVLSKEDTATAAYRARRLVAKITPKDAAKIDLATELTKQHVDLERIFAD